MEGVSSDIIHTRYLGQFLPARGAIMTLCTVVHILKCHSVITSVALWLMRDAELEELCTRFDREKSIRLHKMHNICTTSAQPLPERTFGRTVGGRTVLREPLLFGTYRLILLELIYERAATYIGGGR